MDATTVITIIDIVNAIKQAFGGDDGVDLLPQEVADMLKSLSDGEQGNNDIESLLVEIKDSLRYDEDYTALQEISSRLELIDTRLDKEFEVINSSLGFICTGIVTIVLWKFFSWIMRLFSV